MEASQHSLLAACITLHSTNSTLAIVPQRGAGLWLNNMNVNRIKFQGTVRHSPEGPEKYDKMPARTSVVLLISQLDTYRLKIQSKTGVV
jgi:hypothetical protein